MVELENADSEMSGEKSYEKEDLESQISIRKATLKSALKFL